MPELLGAWPAFSRRFGGTLSGEAGAEARCALRRLIQPFVLRRTKGQVLSDLPARTEIQHSVALSGEEARLYEVVRRAALAQLAAGAEDPRMRVRVLAEITRLRRLCCHPGLAVDDAVTGSSKLESLLSLVSDLREGRSATTRRSRHAPCANSSRSWPTRSWGTSLRPIKRPSRAKPWRQASSTSSTRRASVRCARRFSLSGPAPRGAGAVQHRGDAAREGFEIAELFEGIMDPAVIDHRTKVHEHVSQCGPSREACCELRTDEPGGAEPLERILIGGALGETRAVRPYTRRITRTLRAAPNHWKRDLADALLDETHRAATLSTEELKALLDTSSVSPG